MPVCLSVCLCLSVCMYVWMDDGFFLLPEMLNFDNFMVCLNNLHPSNNYKYEKAKVTREEKGDLVQILNFLDVSVILNTKNETSTDVYHKDTNTHDYIPYDSAHPESYKKNVPYNLAKKILVFVTDTEKVELTLNELIIIIILIIYIISNAFYNAKFQGPASKPKNKSNNIPFVTSFHEDTDNKIIMKNIKRKKENTPSTILAIIF